MLCRVCNNQTKELYILYDVPKFAQYLSAEIQKNNKINLKIVKCTFCELIQLDNEPVSYCCESIRACSISDEMIKFRRNQFKDFIKKYKINDSIAEFGSGGGEYLNILHNINNKVIGYELSKKLVNDCGGKYNLNTINAYIGDVEYRFPKKEKRKNFKAFFILNYIEHLPDLKNFFDGVNANISDDAVGLIEVPNYKTGMLSEFIIDHLYYFTKETLERALNFYGFKVLNIKSILNGYALSAEVKKKENKEKDFTNILCNFENLKQKLETYLENKPFYVVYGAGHQSFTTISKIKYYYPLFFVDDAEFKQNKYASGINILIKHPKNLYCNRKIDTVLIIAGSYNGEIYKKISKIKHIKNIAIIDHTDLIIKKEEK